MSRTLFAWIIIGLVAAASGCAMCASPHDYCGPTCAGGHDEHSGAHSPRAGSILSGVTRPTLTVAEMSGVEGKVSDIIDGVLISVEDRKVEEVAQPDFQAVADNQALAENSSIADGQDPQVATRSQGWTAQASSKTSQK